jgi:hypothetical protein
LHTSFHLRNSYHRVLFCGSQVDNLEYASENTVLFMRLSVIVTDLSLLYATWLYLTSITIPAKTLAKVFTLVAFNAGLLLVDHIHFQYNGVLMGVLVLCLYCASAERYLLLAAAFSTLVLMKHLFVPLAPIFAAFLIQRHCFVKNSVAARNDGEGKFVKVFSVVRILQLVAVALTALVMAFGPFLLQHNGTQQLQQIMTRLFPFGRGLVHAYWAPNVWALYCAADKMLSAVIRKINVAALNALLRSTGTSAMLNNSASGIVGDFAFAVLPAVTAPICLFLLFGSLVPAVIAVYRRPTTQTLLVCLVYASLSSFMFGYHVHEKAIIIPLVLQTFTLVYAEPADEVSYEMPRVHSAAESGHIEASKGVEYVAGVTGVRGEGVNDSEGTTQRGGLRSRKGAKAGAEDAVAADKSASRSGSRSGSRSKKHPAGAVVGESSPPASPTSAPPATATAGTGAAVSRSSVRTAQDVFLNKALLGLLAIAGVAGLFPLFFTLREVFTKSK